MEYKYFFIGILRFQQVAKQFHQEFAGTGVLIKTNYYHYYKQLMNYIHKMFFVSLFILPKTIIYSP